MARLVNEYQIDQAKQVQNGAKKLCLITRLLRSIAN